MAKDTARTVSRGRTQKMDALEANRHLLFNYLLLASEDDFFFFHSKKPGREENVLSSELTMSIH